MSLEEEYEELVTRFLGQQYRVERRLIGGADTIVVANKPECVGGITVYRRSIQLHREADGQWHTRVGAATLPWESSFEALERFVSKFMESSDAEHEQEQERHLRAFNA